MSDMVSYKNYLIRVNPKDSFLLQYQDTLNSSSWISLQFGNGFTTNHKIVDLIVAGHKLIITEIGNGRKQTYQMDLKVDGNRLCGSSLIPVSGTYEKLDQTDDNSSTLSNMVSKLFSTNSNETNSSGIKDENDYEQRAAERELKYQKEQEEKRKKEEENRLRRLTCPYCDLVTDMETNIVKYNHFFHSECITLFENSDEGKLWIKDYEKRLEEKKQRRNKLNDLWISQTKEGSLFSANTKFSDEEDKQEKISIERKKFEDNLDKIKNECRERKEKIKKDYDSFAKNFTSFFDNYEKAKVDNWVLNLISKYNYSYFSSFREADFSSIEEIDYSIQDISDLDKVSEFFSLKFEKLPKKYGKLFLLLRFCIDLFIALNGVTFGISTLHTNPVKSVFLFILSLCFIISPFLGNYLNNKKRKTILENNIRLLEEYINK